jgi:hypothetical protein
MSTPERLTIDEDYADLREVLSTTKFPIFRRKIIKTMPVHGLWWMEENQWIRFLWCGHLGTVLKSGEDPDRVLSTRMFEIGSCYVRMLDDRVDLEGLSRTTKLSRSNGRWKTDSFRGKKTLREWLTVSVTLDEFDRIQEFMGPELQVCNHKDK